MSIITAKPIQLAARVDLQACILLKIRPTLLRPSTPVVVVLHDVLRCLLRNTLGGHSSMSLLSCHSVQPRMTEVLPIMSPQGCTIRYNERSPRMMRKVSRLR